jgi:hypothetical protein
MVSLWSGAPGGPPPPQFGGGAGSAGPFSQDSGAMFTMGNLQAGQQQGGQRRIVKARRKGR